MLALLFPNSIKKETEKGMCFTVHLNVFCCCLLQKLWFIVNVWNVELYSVILMMESNKACHYMPHGHSLYHKANTKTWNYAPAEILWLSPSTLAWVSRAKHLPAWSRPQNIFSLWLLSRNLFVFFFFFCGESIWLNIKTRKDVQRSTYRQVMYKPSLLHGGEKTLFGRL